MPETITAKASSLSWDTPQATLCADPWQGCGSTGRLSFELSLCLISALRTPQGPNTTSRYQLPALLGDRPHSFSSTQTDNRSQGHIRVLLMDFFPVLTTDTPLPRRPTLKANPPPTAHQPLPVGGQPPPLLHCGSWVLLSPQRALGTGGKRRDNLSAQNNLCYTDLSLDNHKTDDHMTC